MKRLKILCSAIAAFSMLALAGCDLEVDNKYYKVAKNATGTVPFNLNEDVNTDTLLGVGPAVTEDTGVSISFKYSGVTSDWQVAFVTTQTFFALPTIQYYPDGSFGGNFFPGSRTKGSTFTMEPYQIYTGTDSGSGYCTISFDTDKKIRFYCNGELAVEWSGDADAGSGTIEDVWTKFIADATDEGVVLRPTSGSGNMNFASGPVPSMSNIHLDLALSADDAKTLYNNNK